MSRPERRLQIGGRSWRAIEAWRGAGSHGLCYFLPLEGDAPAPHDRDDRRAALEPGVALDELDESTLVERHRAAVPLTDTEARFEDDQGRSWLAQSTGPVWVGTGVAEGLTGVRFTSLSGPLERWEGGADRMAGASRRRLATILRELRGTG